MFADPSDEPLNKHNYERTQWFFPQREINFECTRHDYYENYEKGLEWTRSSLCRKATTPVIALLLPKDKEREKAFTQREAPESAALLEWQTNK